MTKTFDKPGTLFVTLFERDSEKVEQSSGCFTHETQLDCANIEACLDKIHSTGKRFGNGYVVELEEIEDLETHYGPVFSVSEFDISEKSPGGNPYPDRKCIIWERIGTSRDRVIGNMPLESVVYGRIKLFTSKRVMTVKEAKEALVFGGDLEVKLLEFKPEVVEPNNEVNDDTCPVCGVHSINGWACNKCVPF